MASLPIRPKHQADAGAASQPAERHRTDEDLRDRNNKDVDDDYVYAMDEDRDEVESLPPSYETAQAEDKAEVASVSSQESRDTTFQDLIDLDIDPAVLLSTVQTLHGILKAAVDSLTSLQHEDDDLEDETTKAVANECRALFDNVDELSRCTYTAENALTTVDPMVYKWANDCVVWVLELQADVERLLEQYHKTAIDTSDASSWAETLISSADEWEPENVVTLHRYLEPLQRFNMSLAEYLPFFRAEFNEQETRSMVFPTAPPESTFFLTLREREQHVHYDRALDDLRRTLYDLKDELKSCVDTLRLNLQTCKSLPTVEPQLRELETSIAAVWATLTELLSNNGSEWIESALAGKMSWDEFCALRKSMGRWRRFRTVFRQLHDELQVEGAKARAPSSSAQETMFALLPEDARPAIDALRELEEVLKMSRTSASEEDGCKASYVS